MTPRFEGIDAAERRKSARFPVNLRGSFFLFSLGSTATCTVTELSLNGCRVHTDRDYNGGKDARIEVSFTLKGAAFRVGGLTQWTKGKNDLGVRFVGMSERREAHLLEVLAEVEAELAATAGKEASERAAAAEAVAAARAQVELLDAELAAKRTEEEAARRGAELAAEQIRAVTRRLEEARRAKTAAERVSAELEAREAARQEALAAAQESESALERREETAAAPIESTVADRGASQAPVPAATGLEQGKDGRSASGQERVEAASPVADSAGALGKERRRETRHAVDAHAKILLLDVRSTIAGRILDVSMSGCGIRFAGRFPVGIYRRVEVEFVLDGLPFRLPGVVQALHDRFTVGIRFLDVSERKQEQLRMVIEEITETRQEEAQAQGADG